MTMKRCKTTENTECFSNKIEKCRPANTLIVTSIQKMSNINGRKRGLKTKDIEIMNNKGGVFCVDETHRSTFGDVD
jgi:type I restriction enzyme R subunit